MLACRWLMAPICSSEMAHSSRVLLVPFPAQGHVSPMLHLARRLHAGGFEVTVAAPDFVHRSLGAGASEGFRFEPIASGLAADGTSAPDFAAIEAAMESSMPAELEQLLMDSRGRVACVLVDLVASWAIPVAQRCGVPVVAGFWPGMLATYRIISAIPELIRRGLISEFGSPLHHEPPSSSKDQAAEEISLAGQAKLRTNDLPWLVGSPASQKSRFKFWLRVLDRAKTLDHLLVNSFPDEAGQPTTGNINPAPTPQTLLVGPLTAHGAGEPKTNHARRHVSMWEADHTCLQWLEKQPPGSVVYVSFGSWVAPLSPESIAEFALGLELAQQPFLWVLRNDKSWRSGLPRGFLDRIGDRGRVVEWAPQEEVLGSAAIGCYLTHCGWNSTLEAIQHEQRLLCYPIAGDQFVNAAFIVNAWGIGAKLEGGDRFAVVDGIRRVMRSAEGTKMQESVLQLKRRVMGGHGNCRAMENLQSFVDIVKNSIRH